MRTTPGLSELATRTSPPPISWLMQLTLDHPRMISLAAGFTDDLSMPVRETRELVANILAKPAAARAALQYGSTAGDGKLRELTSIRLARQDGRQAGEVEAGEPDRMIITHGSQQLLYLTVECLCNPGDIIIVEDPTYFVFLSILQSHGVRCRGVPLEADGVDLEGLEKVLEQLKAKGELPRLKALYLVSYHQNPSGVTTSLEKKRAALKLLRRYERAAGHPLYLIEDAAYRDLLFQGDDTPSALALRDGRERVIYAGTYSKPFATGIRVGFGCLPKGLLEPILRIKGNHDFGTSNLPQQILAGALSSKLYEEHLAELKARYRKKAAIKCEALKAHFPDSVKWLEPKGGLYVWAAAPEDLRTDAASKIFKAAMKSDVLFVPGNLCYGEDSSRPVPRHEMRLSFGGAGEESIRKGIERLGKVLQKAGA